MADFTDLDLTTSAIGALGAELPRGDRGERDSTSFLGNYDSMGSTVPAPPVVVTYAQRIWDLTDNRWVYYELASIDPAPAPTSTAPHHSGNLKAASHEVLKARKG